MREPQTICVKVGWKVLWIGFPTAWEHNLERVEANGNLFYRFERLPDGANVRIEKNPESKTYVLILESIATKPA